MVHQARCEKHVVIDGRERLDWSSRLATVWGAFAGSRSERNKVAHQYDTWNLCVSGMDVKQRCIVNETISCSIRSFGARDVAWSSQALPDIDTTDGVRPIRSSCAQCLCGFS